MGLNSFFIDASTLPQDFYGFIQLLFLFGAYGRLLMLAADMIGDGSELLLLVPSMSAVVGSTLVPVLGAVPDGALVLFSGLGPNAQKELDVGIGALAGSTVMLLSVQWGLSVLGGRVSLDHKGKPIYRRRSSKNGLESYGATERDGLKRESSLRSTEHTKLKSKDKWSLFGSGAAVTTPIRKNAAIMVLTLLPYFIIQGAGQFYDKLPREQLASKERGFAVAALALCVVGFVAYLGYQYKEATKDAVKADRVEDIAIRRVQRGQLSMAAVLVPFVTENKNLSQEELRKRAQGLVRPFFYRHDLDSSGHIDESELQEVFASLGEHLRSKQVRKILAHHDRDGSGTLDFREFLDMLLDYVKELSERRTAQYNRMSFKEVILGSVRRTPSNERLTDVEDDEDQDGEEYDDDDEMPEDLKDLSYQEQQRKIKLRAAWLMTAGTALCLVFSDPMTDVLSEFGTRTGIPSFYISFMIAPFITNFTELMASYRCSTRKTVKSMTVALAVHPGSVVFNNTYVLGIFLTLLLAKNLAWRFTAETISIVVIELLMFLFSFKKVLTFFDGLLIISFFPLAAVLVYILQTYAGLD